MSKAGGAVVGGGRFSAVPDARLRPFVVEYWGMTRDLGAAGGVTITPDRFGELVCCVGGLVAVEGGERRDLPPCFLVGLLDGPLRLEAPGVVRCAAARLQPWAIGHISARIGAASGRAWHDAGPLFAARLEEVVDLVGRGDWGRMARILDEVLIRGFVGLSPRAKDLDLAARFVEGEARGTASVALGRRVTARQVERRVRELTRTSPKRLACLARFQAARDAIWADPSIDLATLAVAAGYSDQPHMTRQFRRYAGQTPSRFARDSALKKSWLESQGVAFVQEPDSRRR